MNNGIVSVFDRYDWATGKIDEIVQLLIALVMVVMFGLLLLSVMSRYVIVRPFFWLAEVSAYLMATVALWGSSSCLRNKGHMQVNMLQDWIRKRVEGPVRLLAPLLVIVGNAVLIYYCYILLVQAGYIFAEFGRFEMSPSGYVQVFWPRLAMPTGGILIILQSVNLIGRAIRSLLRGEVASARLPKNLVDGESAAH